MSSYDDEDESSLAEMQETLVWTCEQLILYQAKLESLCEGQTNNPTVEQFETFDEVLDVMHKTKRKLDSVRAKLVTRASKRLKQGDNPKNIVITWYDEACPPPSDKDISEVFKNWVWKKVKFIGSEEDELKASKRVLLVHYGPDCFTERPANCPSIPEIAIKYYAKKVSTVCNDTRNAVNQRIREAVFKRLDDRKELPDMDTILGIIKRKLDLSDPKNLEMAVWWFDVVIPRCTANCTDYAVGVRYYQIVSEAKHMTSADKPDVTASTEAYAVVAYENSMDKWTKHYELIQQFKPKKVKITLNQTAAWCDEKNRLDPKTHLVSAYQYGELIPKYTIPDSGQIVRGGWKEEGMRYYLQLKDNLKLIRGRQEFAVAFEQKVLTEMRRIHGIVAQSSSAQWRLLHGNKGGRRRPRVPPGLQNSFVSSSDEED